MSDLLEIGRALGGLDSRITRIEAEIKMVRRIVVVFMLALSGLSTIVKNDVLTDIATKVIKELLR
jgi:hypothetical protein